MLVGVRDPPSSVNHTSNMINLRRRNWTFGRRVQPPSRPVTPEERVYRSQNMTIDYDASALSGWTGARHLFLRYHGTILSGLFRGPMFWVPNLLHIIFCALGGQFATPPVASAAPQADATLETAELPWTGLPLGSTELQLSWQMATVSLPLLFFFIVFCACAAAPRKYICVHDKSNP